MFVVERGGPILWLNCQFSWKRNAHIQITIYCSLNAGNTISKNKRGEKLQKFPGFAASPRYATFFPFFPICNIFAIICQCRFFLNSWIGPDILMKVFEGYIILLISAGWLLFNKRFQSGALLKLPPSSPLMKEFCQ